MCFCRSSNTTTCFLLNQHHLDLQGVTGFGSSIALLSTWVISRAIGVRACESLRPPSTLSLGFFLASLSKQQAAVGPAGTFEQLVLTDSLSALVASPPLLYVTNAKKFCDWRLVLTAVTFQVITAVQASISTCQTVVQRPAWLYLRRPTMSENGPCACTSTGQTMFNSTVYCKLLHPSVIVVKVVF